LIADSRLHFKYLFPRIPYVREDWPSSAAGL